MANVKMKIETTDGKIEDFELTQEQYVDMMSALYKPQVKQVGAPAPVAAPKAQPVEPEVVGPIVDWVPISPYEHVRLPHAMPSQNNLIGMRDAYLMMEERNKEKVKAWAIAGGCALAGILVGVGIAALCAARNRSDD